MPVPLKVCHVAMGDLWAGAEAQLVSFLKEAIRVDGIEWSVVLFNEGRLADELRKLSIPPIVISETKHNVLSIAGRLARAFRTIRPDIVHTHKYKDSILASLVARGLGVPAVVRVVHGLPEPFHGLKNVKMAGYVLADRCVTSLCTQKVIAVSRDIYANLVQSHGPDKVAQIHNGVDLETVRVTIPRAHMLQRWHCNDQTMVIGAVGRLVPVKGHGVLLEAFKLLRGFLPNAKLFLVGDGLLLGQLQAEARRLEVEHAVIFTGHQEQVANFINMMDVFVLPSLHEGIPMVLLEALALGRPVIASRVGGIPEVITHRENGLLVEPGDPWSLADAVSELHRDQTLAGRIGRTGRSTVESEFTANRMVSKTLSLYQSLLGKGRIPTIY
ncbi:MAG: glycosyltransferase family 4 protein [Nitrospira sp.]|nr:MAG: glycosyltransferase family 4 protein [Nitrospira sp.]